MTDEIKQRMEEILDQESAELFVCLTPCFIYLDAGKEDGTPKQDSDIIYDAVRDEVLQLDTNKRISHYVKCLLPKQGWVYLKDENNEYPNTWQLFEDEYYQKRKKNKIIPGLLKHLEKYQFDDENENENEIKNDNNLSSNNGEMKAPKPMMDPEMKNDEYGIVSDLNERRDYQNQKMQKCTIENAPQFEIDEADQKCFYKNKYLRGLLFFFRRRPFVPGLIILVIKAFIECMIIMDFVSDLLVSNQLRRGISEGRVNPIIFALSASFISAPYLIAWTVLSQGFARKIADTRKSFCLIRLFWIIFVILFDIAPIGVLMIIIADLYHLIECVIIQPIYYLFTLGRDFRFISYEELGYYKLRRVGEIFSEAMPQAILQLYLVIRASTTGQKVCDKCELLSVIIALISSGFVLILWCTIIFLEGAANGMGFVEYTTIIFQGSFKFVPSLPAIERGTDKGEKVNWTFYKFSVDSIGSVGAALNNPTCKLKRMKISDYTVKGLHRYGCRYFGQSLKNRAITKETPEPIEVIQSRMADEIEALFNQFDRDKSKSFDYAEFLQVCLIIKWGMEERCLRYDVDNVYLDLADGYIREIWLLDLLMKIKGSLEPIPLLDYTNPLQNAFIERNIKMISLLVWSDYDQRNDITAKEWELATSSAVTMSIPPKGVNMKDKNNKHEYKKFVKTAKCALALSEHKGIPIVIRLIKGNNLLPMDDDGKSDPYVRITVEEQVKLSQIKLQTLNPIWNDDELFIIDTERMGKLLGWENTKKKSMANLKKDDDNEDIATLVLTKQLPDYAIKSISNSHPELLKKHTEMFEELTDEKIDSNIRNKSFAGGLNRRFTRYSSDDLVITFRVFDYDKDDEDDFMGSYKMRISLRDDETNLETFHEKIHTVQLQYMDPTTNKKINAGTISFKIYLNIASLYAQHGIHYIDLGDKAKVGSSEGLENVWEEQKMIGTQRGGRAGNILT